MSDVVGTQALGRLGRLASRLGVHGQVRGETHGDRVRYFLGTQHLGDNAPSARKRLREMASVHKKEEAKS